MHGQHENKYMKYNHHHHNNKIRKGEFYFVAKEELFGHYIWYLPILTIYIC